MEALERQVSGLGPSILGTLRGEVRAILGELTQSKQAEGMAGKAGQLQQIRQATYPRPPPPQPQPQGIGGTEETE